MKQSVLIDQHVCLFFLAWRNLIQMLMHVVDNYHQGFKLQSWSWLRCVYRNRGQLWSCFGFGDLQSQNVAVPIVAADFYLKP